MSEETTAEKPITVLHSNGTTKPPLVLSQGMTEKEWEIFYKLLIDLFVEKPGQKQNFQRSKDYENVTTSTGTKRAGNRTPSPN